MLDFPVLQKAEGTVEGALVELSSAKQARFDYYEHGYHAETVVVETDGGQVEALCYLHTGGGLTGGDEDWSFEDWLENRAVLAREAARDFMLGFGRYPAEVMVRRYPMLLVRAASRLRAQSEEVPNALNRSMSAGDIEITSRRLGYANFFSIEDYTLSHKTFAGGVGAEQERAVFISGDAACLLPYDPVRDRVLVIEQFRPGPMARGDLAPWLLEPIAGRVDPDETPEEAARREALEEAGLTVERLISAPNYYPSPAAKTEFLYNYIAVTELPDGLPRNGGLETEGEDIRSHLISFTQLMELVETGEARNGPLCILALWLERIRPGLRTCTEIA